MSWLLSAARCWAKIASRRMIDSYWRLGTTRVEKYASSICFKSTAWPQASNWRATRLNSRRLGWCCSTWPVCRKAMRFSPTRTGMAVSHIPAKQCRVCASTCADSAICCCICRHAAQDLFVRATRAQNGFSFRWPVSGKRNVSTGRSPNGRPVASANALS